ncbi:type II toxin-antitoxin system death-on-curing family toxin [Variovorax paradoxus]|uniref:Type II toxin-antitoxin system death-on-curing family toxin n=1 Tax=Variovorax paradoxus TaxID=34073 RepID=A0A5Q0LVU2_VARPD|nr:type II toxin-antitoxin system death-on-curing family toxin [Variovorax paradoxus]QFZ81296.1 type II toxin-antitoxin system death-on-curing family toxin [Variovorax paradoxus]QFZ87407.1 type II toxin-antitoxin system death-on-curing family toxin [Variovorax paradoxus]
MTAANQPWMWLSAKLMALVHEEQLAEHGGPAGIRDEGMLASAMGRPQHRALYESPDAAALAACYAFGIARNHPFVDGNKRTAFVAMEVFLDLNGFEFTASDEECVLQVLALAAGEVEEETFAQWIRDRVVSQHA